MPLQPSSIAISKRDQSLPGLQLLLDEDALTRQLGAKQVTRTDLRYKPGVSCVAALYVVGLDGAEYWLCAKAYTQGRFEQIKGRDHWQTGRWRVGLLEDIYVAFIPPQRDRKLKALSKLLDPEKESSKLAQIVGDALTSHKLRILRYKPNRRLVAQLVDPDGERKAMLKIQRPNTFDAAERGARIAMNLGGAKVIAVNKRCGAIVYDWLPGTSLCPVTGMADPTLFRMAGGRIAEHHWARIELPRLSHLTRRSEVKAVRRVVADLANIMPDHAKRLSGIERRATAALLAQSTQHGLIQGDFSADQVVSNADDVQVIDWDRAANGDQGRDIGSFMARLDIQSLAGLIAPEIAKQLKTALLEGYKARHAPPPSSQAQHICHLVLLLTEPFRAQSPDWQGLTCALMDHIEVLLSAVPIAALNPALPHLADALALEVVGPLISDQTNLTLTAPPTLYRHKPKKRAMIRYACRSDDGKNRTLLGKMQSKGPDKRTPALQTTLRATGLDGKEPGSVGVPQVVDIPNHLDMWFMEHVPGACLRDLQDDGQSQAFVRAGAALGHLHRSAVVPDRVWTHKQEMEVLANAICKAALTRPTQKHRIMALLTWAEHATVGLPHQRPGCIHRDFYPDQVIVDEDQIWIVDLDLVALGDPAIDVGNFLAHLAEYAIRKHGTAAMSQTLEAAFLRGYHSKGASICIHRIRTFRTISLMRHIHISQLFSDRRHAIPVLLAECEALTACI